MAQPVLAHPSAPRSSRPLRPAADRASVPRADRTAPRPSRPSGLPAQPWATSPDSAPRDRVDVEVTGPADAGPVRGTEVVVASAALDDVALLRSAARADTVRIRFSAALPTTGAVRALVAVLEGHLLAVGRRREDVRLVLEVETVVARDEADATRRRSWLAHVEAFAGASWAPSASWVVAPPERVLAEGAALAREVGVDVVALALVGPSQGHAEALRAAALAA